jgi:YVTN family beta-propeller protein
MRVKQSMSPAMPRKLRLMAWLCAGSLVVVPCAGLAGDGKGGRSATASIRGERVPSGVRITPTAAPGALFEPLHPDLPTRPDCIAGQAVTTAVSPDGTTLLIVTSGYNRNAGPDGAGIPAESNEYIFVYDITGKNPVKRQVLQVPNTFVGLAWHPNGQEFYVSGGPDDNVHVYHVQGAAWAEAAVIPLGHAKPGPTDLGGLSVANKPNAAGIAVNTSGTFLVVANHENDSISVVDVQSRIKVGELDLRPGKINAADEGQPGGAYPFWVAIKGETKVYITSQRDRQVVVVDIDGGTPRFVRRITVGGQPNKMLLNRAQSLLFVANGNSDTVSVLDTEADTVIDEFSTTAPQEMFKNRQHLKGSNPNSLALTPNERFLLVTNGGTNAVAVIKLASALLTGNDVAKEKDDDDDRSESRVIGLLPTGRYPNAVSISQDGSQLFIVNGNSNAGPNPGACRDTISIAPGSQAQCNAQNHYVWQLTKAGFLFMPMPTGAELAKLTLQVARNNGFLKPAATQPSKKMAFLRERIHQVAPQLTVVMSTIAR